MFSVNMGIPEMKEFWLNLELKINSGKANREEQRLYKKLGKALHLISLNPRYPGLQTHEIKKLSERAGGKVWQSYLENNTPSAGRIFWMYGPDRNDITIIGWTSHPDDKADSYDKVILSSVERKSY